jgi:pimeloyl-ACP methyl ester carboxylesterase
METKEINGIYYNAGPLPLNPGNHTIIFIHGAANSRKLWNRQLPEISEYVNTLALDLPGHGKSGGPGMDTISGYADVVLKFITDLKVKKPLLCGLSMGGAITLEVLIRENTPVRGGILINTGARLRVAPGFFGAIEKDYAAFLGTFEKFALSESSHPECLRELMEDASALEIKTALDDFHACNSFDIMDRLSEIDLPVLILTAEEDRISPPRYGTYFEEKISNARRVHIENASHFSPLEQPGPVNRAIIDFVEELKR